MDIYELPFLKIIILREDIAEVIVNDGVQMNLPMVEQYHQLLLSHLRPPFSLLVNKINAYTYDFAAQQDLATLDEINKMAVVSYTRVTTTSTEYLSAISRKKNWDLRIFQDRDAAYAWLVAEQDKLREPRAAP